MTDRFDEWTSNRWRRFSSLYASTAMVPLVLFFFMPFNLWLVVTLFLVMLTVSWGFFIDRAFTPMFREVYHQEEQLKRLGITIEESE